jgi:DNA repair photolyase
LIISASRRTDIPAFFGEWFMRRIEEGRFVSVNPFNPRQTRTVSLLPEDVDAIVFWTKNPRPFLRRLKELDAKGYRYYFLFTLNDYPKVFEPGMGPVDERIQTFTDVSRKIGKERVIWRYDPIVISSATPVEYHLDKISSIAHRLRGFTERMIISFLTFYGKVKKRLENVTAQQGIKFQNILEPPFGDDLHRLAGNIKERAQDSGFEVFSCAQPACVRQAGIGPGSCIDGELIRRMFGIDTVFPKDTRQRKECMCAESVDLGAYNTCRFFCTYCYANVSEKAVRNNLANHSIESPSLIQVHESKDGECSGC